MPNPHAPYPPAFKTEAVRLVHSGDKSIAKSIAEIALASARTRTGNYPHFSRPRSARMHWQSACNPPSDFLTSADEDAR